MEGEEVLVKANSVSSAIYNTTANFFPIFMGPYRIEKQIARYTYLLKDVEKNKIIGKYHGDSLRKYKQNIDP